MPTQKPIRFGGIDIAQALRDQKSSTMDLPEFHSFVDAFIARTPMEISAPREVAMTLNKLATDTSSNRAHSTTTRFPRRSRTCHSRRLTSSRRRLRESLPRRPERTSRSSTGWVVWRPDLSLRNPGDFRVDNPSWRIRGARTSKPASSRGKVTSGGVGNKASSRCLHQSRGRPPARS